MINKDYTAQNIEQVQYMLKQRKGKFWQLIWSFEIRAIIQVNIRLIGVQHWEVSKWVSGIENLYYIRCSRNQLFKCFIGNHCLCIQIVHLNVITGLTFKSKWRGRNLSIAVTRVFSLSSCSPPCQGLGHLVHHAGHARLSAAQGPVVAATATCRRTTVFGWLLQINKISDESQLKEEGH